jgi:hypothetical protein
MAKKLKWTFLYVRFCFDVIDKNNHIQSICFRTFVHDNTNNYQNSASEVHETLLSQKTLNILANLFLLVRIGQSRLMTEEKL